MINYNYDKVQSDSNLIFIIGFSFVIDYNHVKIWPDYNLILTN